MATASKQYKRLVRLVGELKENRYPNAISFSKKLRDEQMNGNESFGCSQKTIQRDIEKLKFDFNAPIAYDKIRQGYYLKHRGWSLSLPVLEQNAMLAIILGAKVAEKIFPNPLKKDIRLGTDIILAENHSELLDSALMDSIYISSGLKSDINQNCFKTIFDCWKKHLSAEIKYKDVNDELTEREIEPHALIFKDGQWLTKAFCYKRDDFRLFALQRIISITPGKNYFEANQKIIKQINNDDFYGYKKTKNIEIICDEKSLLNLQELPLHNNQDIKKFKNNFIVKIPEIAENIIIRWILSQSGYAIITKPEFLKNKIRKQAELIANNHKT